MTSYPGMDRGQDMTDRAEVLHAVLATCRNHADDRMIPTEDFDERTPIEDVCGTIDDVGEVSLECEAACSVRLTSAARDRAETIGQLVDAILAAQIIPVTAAPARRVRDPLDADLFGNRRRA